MGSVGNNNQDLQEALQYYREDGYYINSILRHEGEDNNLYEIDDKERYYISLLDKATNGSSVKQDTLYRIVDMNVVFGKMTDIDQDNLRAHLLFGDNYYDRGEYMQSIKAKMEKIVDKMTDKVVEEKGFMSTTSNYDEAMDKYSDSTHSSYNGVILELKNTKGLKGVDMGGDEHEVLLKRGYKYKFKKAKVKNNMVVIETEIVRS